MDDELFNLIYRIVINLSPQRRKHVQYADSLIILIYFWSVIRNKPVGWACHKRNAPHQLGGYLILPSQATISRRVKQDCIQQLLDQIEQEAKNIISVALIGCWLIDAKPFVINPYTKDKQAKRGWAYDGYSKGYKFYAVCDLDQNVIAWQVHPMNASEQTVAKSLIRLIDRPGYLIGDSAYDTNDLHVLTADQNLQLLAPRKTPGGNIGVRARYPNRLHAIDMLETHTNVFGPTMYSLRTTIERMFSRMTSQKIGLDHLPGWVRTLPRVRRFIQAKMILYALQK